MLSKILCTGAAAAALALAPAHLRAQESQTPEAPTPAPAAAVDTAQSEADRIAEQIQAIQQKALQDPQIRAANAALSASINAATEKADPNFKANAARAQALKAEVAAAQAAQDNARLHELAAEAKQLQEAISAARSKAMEDPEVQKQLETFKADLFKKMVEIDPKAQQLVARLGELSKQ